MKLFVWTAAAAVGLSSAAMAGPSVMSDAQLDNIVAGADVTYYLYTKKNGDYKIVEYDDANNRNGAGRGKNNNRGWNAVLDEDVQVTGTCDDEGAGSTCSVGGQDFEWADYSDHDVDNPEWHWVAT